MIPVCRFSATSRTVHEPDRVIAAAVSPQNVAIAVAIEIAGAGNRPAGRDIAETGN
jgi:hypothetical protein